VSEPGFSGAVSGNAAFDGSVNGKVIVVSNLYDPDALPWHTDWYRQRPEKNLGGAAADTYRVYFNDHADYRTRRSPVSGPSTSSTGTAWLNRRSGMWPLGQKKA
jgi:hypothetical protein